MLEKFKKQKIQKPQAIYGGNDVIIEDHIMLKKDIIIDDIDGL